MELIFDHEMSSVVTMYVIYQECPKCKVCKGNHWLLQQISLIQENSQNQTGDSCGERRWGVGSKSCCCCSPLLPLLPPLFLLFLFFFSLRLDIVRRWEGGEWSVNTSHGLGHMGFNRTEMAKSRKKYHFSSRNANYCSLGKLLPLN